MGDRDRLDDAATQFRTPIVRRHRLRAATTLVVCAVMLPASAAAAFADRGTTEEFTEPVETARGERTPAGTDLPPPSHVPYTPTGADDPHPNVVLISTDDQSVDRPALDAQDPPVAQAREGITFKNMILPAPGLCPAPAEMITGQFAQNNGVHTNTGPYGGLASLKAPDNTLPAWLQQGHYRTAMVGKYLNGYRAEQGVPRGWDYWNAATQDGFGYYNYYTYNDGSLAFHNDVRTTTPRS